MTAAGHIAELSTREPDGARILGIHLEGPFLSPLRAGTHPVERLAKPDLELLMSLFNAGPVTMVTLAPELHRFEAKEGGVGVRFWLYQKPDGKIATLFDACEICGPVGFYKGAQGVICKDIAHAINPQSVGMPGGCNPIPLK